MCDVFCSLRSLAAERFPSKCTFFAQNLHKILGESLEVHKTVTIELGLEIEMAEAAACILQLS